MWSFLTTGVVNKNMRSKNKISENYGCNNLRFFDVWPNFPFTTKETKRGY